MRHLFAILLVVLFPLHAAFAAAAGYCQHETESPQAAHLGHHYHQHDGKTDQPSGGGGLQIDPDCGFCHLSFSSYVPTLPPSLEVDNPQHVIAAPVSDFRSAIVEQFDRPPRASLA